MYRPNFCSECGERVVRARWRAWTSRSFCGACDARFRKKRFVFAIAFFVCVSAFGFLLGRAGRPAPPPLTIVRGDGDGPEGRKERADASLEKGRRGVSGAGASRKDAEPPTDPLETVSICGARTKKGTPCSRRVRGVGRCWQHRGKSAMLSPEKLIVKDG